MTLAVVMAVIALGVLLIHLLDRRHSDGIAAFHHSHSRATLRGRRTRRRVE
ncbi:hypothetical protein ABT075_35790 [Streptomyces sp. NPDC002677]|uniref:hypothetical protein n=1 Tax=Streptomyces sp. NPDC002677 TaxID=3154774 RepID=UPI00331BA5D1